jgi:hypothetical protein
VGFGFEISMKSLHRTVGLLAVGSFLVASSGCGSSGAPPTGTQAIVPPDHLQQQQAVMDAMKKAMKEQAKKPGKKLAVNPSSARESSR